MPTLLSVTRTALQEAGDSYITCEMPTSPAPVSGNIIVLIPCQNSDGAGGAISFTTPSGYSLLDTQSNGTGGANAAVYYKTAAGSDSNVNVVSDTAASGNTIGRGLVLVFGEHDGIDTDAGAHATAHGNPSSGNLDSPSITPTVNGSLIVSALSGNIDGTPTVTTLTLPSELTTKSLDVGEAYELHNAVGIATQGTAGATSAMTWGNCDDDSELYATFSFTIKAAAAGGPSIPILTHHIRQQS